MKGQHFTCYPGFEEGISDVDGAKWSGKAVEVGKQIITGRGMGVALDFALALVERLEGAEKAAQLKKRGTAPGMQLYKRGRKEKIDMFSSSGLRNRNYKKLN